jgi:hypothetical protein
MQPDVKKFIAPVCIKWPAGFSGPFRERLRNVPREES